MHHLPFHVPGVYKGLAKTEGIAHFSQRFIALEFETKDSIIGVISSGNRKAVINFWGISAIALKRGWGKVTLLLHSNSLSTFSTIPGNRGAALALVFPARFRDEMRLIVSEINMQLADEEMRRAEGQEDTGERTE